MSLHRCQSHSAGPAERSSIADHLTFALLRQLDRPNCSQRIGDKPTHQQKTD